MLKIAQCIPIHGRQSADSAFENLTDHLIAKPQQICQKLFQPVDANRCRALIHLVMRLGGHTGRVGGHTSYTGLSLKSGKILGNFVTTLKRSKSYRGKANVRSESGRTDGRPCGEQENLGMKLVAPCCCSVVPLGGVLQDMSTMASPTIFFENGPCLQFSTVDFARFWAAVLDSYQAE